MLRILFIKNPDVQPLLFENFLGQYHWYEDDEMILRIWSEEDDGYAEIDGRGH